MASQAWGEQAPPRFRGQPVVSVLLAGVVVLACFAFLRPPLLGGTASFVIVNGPSMSPALRDGNIAVLKREDRYAAGDIVAFNVGGAVAIHRIVLVDEEGFYRTRGDNNPRPDAWLLTGDNIRGRLVWRIPLTGHLLQEHAPLVFGAMIGLCVTLVVFWPADRGSRGLTGAQPTSRAGESIRPGRPEGGNPTPR
jgi:signal peptidase